MAMRALALLALAGASPAALIPAPGQAATSQTQNPRPAQRDAGFSRDFGFGAWDLRASARLGQEQPERPGLVLDAADGARRVVRVAPAPNFTLAATESIHPALDPGFTLAATGVLKILRAGRYRISAEATVLVAGRDVGGRETELSAGEHAIAILFKRAAGRPARLQLVWESDHFKAEPVPAAALFFRERTPELERGLRAERGRDLVEELGCVNCHKAEGSTLRGRRGPDLTRVGSRADVRWIARWLEDPRRFSPGAAMPALLDEAERRDVAAYLSGLRDPQEPPREAPPDRHRLERGRELFEKVGCARCHADKLALAGLGSKYSARSLADYLLDPLKVDPGGRMPQMLLSEDEARMIAEHLVQSRNAEFEAEVPARDPARGRTIVGARGCLACHAVEDLRGDPAAPPLAALPPGRECRSARYGLSKGEREEIDAFLAEFARAPDRSEAPAFRFHRAVRAFRCTSCHALDDALPRGLAEVPPPLTDAGNKLRAGWLGEVLLKKKRIRPWMGLKMPHFGEENMAPLVQAFAAAAGAPPGEGDPAAAAPPEEVREGVRLAGAAGGLSCISCHDFKDRISLATRGPDLTEMAARMGPDWFKRWLRDPGRLQPGTAMPQFFQSKPEAQAEREMDLLWAALSAGKRMPAPEGFPDPAGFLLAVKDEPVVLRTFLPGASPRAFAVGLPGGRSYCWDAEPCRLLTAWRGEFLDMAPVWGGRGGQPARILGERTYSAPALATLRIGDPEKEPRARFRGFQLAEKVPEFLYDLDGVPVAERITADAAGLSRRYSVGATPGDVWFLAGDDRFTASEGERQGARLRLSAGGRPLSFTVTVPHR